MTAGTLTKSVGAAPHSTGLNLFATLIFIAAMAIRLIAYHHHHGAIFLEDDGYYYKLVAENLAATGRSTFDGQVLTNGYHPLWLLLLTLQMFLVGPNDAVTVGMEVALAAAGLWFTLVSFRNTSLLFRTVFATLYTLLAWPMVAKGMEVSLLFFAFGLFIFVLDGYLAGRRSAMQLGFAAVLCVGARIDAAAFVLPALLLAARGVRPAILMLVPLAICGAIYAAVNLALFGIVVPVSGAVKSLGGFQINHVLLAQVAQSLPHEVSIQALVRFGNGLFGRPLLFALLLAVAVALAPRRRRDLVLTASFFVGFAAYAVKLVFMSSWIVWPWYGFPAVLAMMILFLVLDGWVEDVASSISLMPQVLVSLLLFGFLSGQQYAGSRPSLASFQGLNLAAVQHFSAIFDGARVAMGDRAGSFAAAYPGPVVQLEGLVNDRAYLQALANKAEIKPLLCARGVKFVLAFQPDLGTYVSVTIPVLRPELTSYAAPALVLSSETEVGHVSDPSFDGQEPDSMLYAWRLKCAAS
jgi:hypothetical protein